MPNESTVDRYSTWEMDALVSSIDPQFLFLSQRYFSTEKYFEGEFIEYDIVENGQRVAPFVSPLANGVPSRRTGMQTYQIKPAYTKLADTVRPTEGFTRTAGEAYGGSLTPMQRIDRQVGEQIATHFNMISNRIELMAVEALFNGGITVTGDNYPTTYVDFVRNVNNTMAVALPWSNAASTPLADIQNHSRTMNREGRGVIVNELVMTGAVYDMLVKHPTVRELVNRDANLNNATGLNFGPRSGSSQAMYGGRLNNQYDLFYYDGYVEDDTGAQIEIMPGDECLFIANQGPNSGMEGRTYYGAIIDMDAGIQARDRFVKARNQWDPSGVEVLTQSAPMIGARRPNATGKLIGVL